VTRGKEHKLDTFTTEEMKGEDDELITVKLGGIGQTENRCAREQEKRWEGVKCAGRENINNNKTPAGIILKEINGGKLEGERWRR